MRFQSPKIKSSMDKNSIASNHVERLAPNKKKKKKKIINSTRVLYSMLSCLNSSNNRVFPFSNPNIILIFIFIFPFVLEVKLWKKIMLWFYTMYFVKILIKWLNLSFLNVGTVSGTMTYRLVIRQFSLIFALLVICKIINGLSGVPNIPPLRCLGQLQTYWLFRSTLNLRT
jgi:hypothetical protein